MEIFQHDKLDSICCLTQRRTYGLHGRCFTWTSNAKSHSQLFEIWGEHKTAIHRKLELYCAFALHLRGNQKLEGKKHQKISFFAWKEWTDSARLSSEGSNWTILQSMRNFCIWTFSFIKEGKTIGELDRRRVQKTRVPSNCWVTNSNMLREQRRSIVLVLSFP